MGPELGPLLAIEGLNQISENPTVGIWFLHGAWGQSGWLGA